MNPFLFVVGSPRSGTTLLERIVDAHPDIAIFHEMWWIVRWYRRRIGLTSDAMVTPELISQLIDYRKFRKRLGMGQEELKARLPQLARADGEPLSYARFMSGVFDLYGEAQGKPLVGDKTPKYVRNIPILHDLWPKAKFVHIIRDGRDVCLSMVNWDRANRTNVGRFKTWAEDRLSTTALWWEWNVRLGREAGESLGPGLHHEVGYESLISQPEERCAELCSFLGVPYDDAMLRFHKGRERMDPDLDAKEAWRPVTSGLRDWRSQLPATAVERLEAAAGGLLDELGYPRAFPNPSSEALEHASKVRRAFAQDVRARGQRLPEGW